MFTKEKKKGITLIALVITIIVLLILVGITISTIFGGDGTLDKAHETKVAGRISKIKDRLTVKHSEDTVKRRVGGNIEPLDDFIDNLKTEGLILDGEEVENYQLTIGKETIDFLGPNPYVYIEVGDVVYYDPTKGVSDPNKLRYTSQIGSSMAAGNGSNVIGNGHSVQIFEAKNTDTKWVVLNNKDSVITLMSAEGKLTTSNQSLNMSGATGYIYAEQELHNICSIYGHGKGTSNRIIYPKPIRIGSPDDINGEGFSQGISPSASAARSMTLEDIEEVTKIKTITQKDAATYYYRQQLGNPSELEWYNIYFKDYFNTNKRPNNDIRIPTLTGYIMGKPLFTYYNIHRNDPQLDYLSNISKDQLFRWSWVASRSVASGFGASNFYVFVISPTGLAGYNLCDAFSDRIDEKSTAVPVRPLVQLKAKIELTPYTENGYKWKVNQD